MEKERLSILLDITGKKKRVQQLIRLMSSPDFWQNQERAKELSVEMANLSEIIDQFDRAKTVEQMEKLELLATLSGPYDQGNVLLSIYAGAGGTEAQDWAEMLLRMYLRYAEQQRFKVELLDRSSGEEAGLKSATLKIAGTRAYGHLKGEAGVHRLVRLSPFDADHARHTSFALIEVIPEISPEKEEEIPEKDLKVEVFRASGHGGQSVNTTDSAVRITHLPTGLKVSCQNERSQLQNKATALKVLQAKLFQLKNQLHKDKIAELRGEVPSAEWGSQIRSYVLHPYKQVKDHRTDFVSSDPEAILNGELEPLIKDFLKHLSEGGSKERLGIAKKSKKDKEE